MFEDYIVTYSESEELTGSMVSFNDGTGLSIVKLVAQFTPVQASTTETYRPITWDTGTHVVVSPTTTASDGTTYTASWSDQPTVFGGYVDLITGVLTVTIYGEVFTGSETWTQNFTGTHICFRHNTGKAATASSSRACTHFRNASITSSSTSQGYYAYNSNGYMQFRPDLSVIPDLASWKQFLTDEYDNGTPVVAYYPLTNPYTIQLTPQDINTLIGTNYVWSDTGNVTVAYIKGHNGVMTVADKYKLDNLEGSVGTITGVSVNGTSVATSGVANITTHPDYFHCLSERLHRRYCYLRC